MASQTKSKLYSASRRPNPRLKCEEYRSLLDKAAWLDKELNTCDFTIVKKVTNGFIRHLEECPCSALSTTKLAIASGYMQQFLLLSKSAIANLDMNDRELKKSCDLKEEESAANYLSDFSHKTESKFVSKYANQVNIRNFNYLISPAIKALNYFQDAFDDDKKEKCINRFCITKTLVLTHLKALFQIFLYYDMESYAYKAACLALFYIKTYITTESNILSASEDVQIAYCNMVRFLLNTGCFDNARTFYKQHFSEFKCDDVNSINSYGLSLIFLLNCEISLRSRKGKNIADKLKEFIECEYIKKNSIKRYALRIMALLLASKFPSATYKFTTNFSEFVEPFQMAISICRRWHMFHLTSGPTDFGDPLWYKFSVFNLISETGELLINFYSSIGFLTDASHYFKVNCNFYGFTLNIVGLSNLQLMGANIDFKNGFLSDTKIKISLFKNLFQSKSTKVDESIFKCKYNQSEDIKNDKEEEIILLSFDIDPFADAESNSAITNVIDSYHKLIELNRKRLNTYDDANENDENPTSKDLFKLINGELNHIQQNRNAFKSTFYLHLRMIFIELMVNYEENESNSNYDFIHHFKQLLLLLENYTMKCYFPQIQNYFKLNLSLTTSMDEQIFHGFCGTLFWPITSFYVKTFICRKMYKEALCYLNKVVEFSTYTFESRLHRCDMFYSRGLVVYKLLKHSQKDNSRYIIKLTCDSLMQSPFLPSSEVETKTPSPKCNTRRKVLANAPKQTHFVSETTKKYATDIREENKECLEGTRRNQLTSNLKLNFEDSPSPITPKVKESDKNSKLKTTIALKTRKTIKSNPLVVYKDDDEDLDSHFYRALNLDGKELDNIESYFANLFDHAKFSREYNISQYSQEDIKASLNKINCYIGLHPSLVLYHNSHYLLYRFSKLNAKNSLVLLYHLAESAQYAAFRYRSIFIAHKKKLLSKEHPDISKMTFKCEDFSFMPYMNELPKNWRFVQIKLIDTGSKFPDLLISRFQVDLKTIFVKIRSKEQEKVLKFFLDEFEEIMKRNSTSMVEVNREIYWKIRYDYDNRLKMLLKSFEDIYLGPFKGIFLGQVDDTTYRSARTWFKKKVLESAKEFSLQCIDINLLDVFSESVIFLSQSEFEVGLKILFDTSDANFISNIYKTKKKYFKNWVTKKQIDLLYKNVSSVGLILDPQIAQFPFESLPTSRQVHQSFFRVPSLRVAAFLYNSFKSSYLKDDVNNESAYYLLNPSNNLQSTETFFKTKLEVINQWKGVIGTEPDPVELKENLENNELYIFFGHGSGSVYYRKIPDGGLDNLNIKPVSIVIGCSSGRVSCEGKLEETYGMPYRFLINGSPCYIGNLWDVTDKDIDLFSDQLFAYSIKCWKSICPKVASLPKAISMSRDVCKLKHLIGCAPVVYGLPLNSIIV